MGESVVVEEDGIKMLIKQFLGNSTFKFIEPNVKVFKCWQLKKYKREFPSKAVVT